MPGGTLRGQLQSILLKGMLGHAQEAGKTEYRGLVLDHHTTKVLSSCARMSDLLEYGVTVVEDLHKQREALPFEVVYFITASPESIGLVLQDFNVPDQPGGAKYPGCHIFFSAPCSESQLKRIQREPALLARLQTLREVNVNFELVDERCFATGQRDALKRLFGDRLMEDDGRSHKATLGVMAERLVSLFLATKDYPRIRFSSTWDGDALPGDELRSSLTLSLASEVKSQLDAARANDPNAFERDCDLLILDRSYDVVAPVIHEFTYEAMARDCLSLQGNVYKYKMTDDKGEPNEIDVVLDESVDEVWADVRHMHIGQAANEVNGRFDNFMKTHKDAAATASAATASRMKDEDNRALAKLIQVLPQFREQLRSYSIHIEIISGLFNTSGRRDLNRLGEIEQGLVLGEIKNKDLVAYLQQRSGERVNEDETAAREGREDIVRAIMCYLATHEAKLDTSKQEQWKAVGRLEDGHIVTMRNLAWLGVKLNKTSKTSKLGGLIAGKKKKAAKRAERPAAPNEQDFTCFRFQPLLAEIVQEMIEGKLSTESYPYVPGSGPGSTAASAPASSAAAGIKSARTRASRHHTATWTSKANASKVADPAAVALDTKRCVVFIMGGMSYNEMRCAAEVAEGTGTEVILGSTSADSPRQFLKQVFDLSKVDPSSL